MYKPGAEELLPVAMKFLIPDIEAHLEQFTGDGRDSLVITGPKNASPTV
jgi:hypothetical protein